MNIALMPKLKKLNILIPKLDSKEVVWLVRIVTLIGMVTPLAVLGIVLWRLPTKIFLPTTPAEFWALVAGIAAVLALGIAVAVGAVAWYGLRSIRLARHDMVTRATRESRALAIQRAEQFSREIIRG